MIMGPGVWERIDEMVLNNAGLKISKVISEKLMRGEFKHIYVDEELDVTGRTIITRIDLNNPNEEGQTKE